jgi:pimeloyl-ACP methyl ester carboxylesterase
VFTPTLSGIGERAHLLSPAIDLATHVADVVNLVRGEELTDVILCGHSYGGCVITGVAEAVPDRIAALVYLDAFILEDGQSLYDVLPAEARQAQIDGTNAEGEGWKVPPIPAAAFNVNERDRAWVDSQCTPHPAAAFTQRLSLSGAGDAIADKSYILAGDFPDSPFPPFLEIARSCGWRTSSIDCGHDIMLDRPEALVAELITVSDRLSA